MTRTRKILVITGASLAGLILVLGIASYAILQSSWFANYVRNKIIATAQESTGGTVEMGRFDVDLNHLTIRIYDFVLHGTEAKDQSPFVRVHLLELHLRLFSGIKHAIDLAYLGVEKPQVNLISYADERTNIPQPKNPKKSSGGNPLQTVVDLKVGQFNLSQGLIQYAHQKSNFQAHGDNLEVLLNYSSVTPGYQGHLAFDPLSLKSDGQEPLIWHVNIPIAIDSNSIRVSGASLSTARSKIGLSASLENANTPIIDAKLNADLRLAEIARSLQLPLHPEASGAPKTVSVEVAVHMDDNNKILRLNTAHIGLGDTTFQASGSLRDLSNPNVAAAFNGNLALAQLESLFDVKSPQANGAVLLNGFARLDAKNNYKVDGKINSRDLSIRQGATRLADVSLFSPFHVDPYLISLDGLQLGALGGTLNAKVFIEQMSKLSVEGNLHNFSIPVLAAVATGKHLGYDGSINGGLRADGNLKAKGTSGYTAQTQLTITPGTQGVPISGRVNARYIGSRSMIDLLESYLALPHSRLDLTGPLNQDLKVNLVSHDLNDFLPAANFGVAKPQSSLPITLQGGTASINADVTGNLAAPHITGHIAMDHFAAQQRTFDLLALDVTASPSNAQVQNGLLTRGELRTTFDAGIGLRKWSPIPASPVSANLAMRNATVPDLLSLAGEKLPATGNVTADIHINGTYGNPLGNAMVQVTNGSAYDQPFSRASANVVLADQLITLQPLEVVSDAGTVDVTGSYRHPRETFLTGDIGAKVTTPAPLDLSKLKPVQQRSAGSAGIVQLNAEAQGSLRSASAGHSFDLSTVTADLRARGLRVQNQDAGDLTLTAQTQNRTVTYRLTSNFAGSNIKVDGNTRLAADYPTDAQLSIRRLGVSKVLSIAGQGAIPVRGTLSADGHVKGTIKTPDADLSFSFVRGLVYQEPIDRLAGSVRYTTTLLDIRSLNLDMPAGSVRVNGSFTHPSNSFSAGEMNLNVASTDIDLAKIYHVHQTQPTIAGTVRLTVDAAVRASQQNGHQDVLVSRLNANLNTSSLQLQGRSLGEANLTAHTTGSNLNYRFDSDLAQSQIHLDGQSQLTTDYPTRATLTFANIKYSNLAPFLTAQPPTQPAFDALVEGNASVSGPVLNAKAVQAKLELTHLSASTNPGSSPTGGPPRHSVTIQNEGPVTVAYRNQTVDIQQFRLRGPSTKVDLSGSIDMKGQTSPINVHAGANIDLGVLQSISPEVYSSGGITLDAAIHGSFSQPLVNGKVELKNANLNYATVSNGLSNGNGVILLTGTGGSIQNLTGESGGGKVSVTGFAGWTGQAITYNLKANADRVRFRQSGVSVTSSAAITLIGNTNRSLVSGNVTIRRIAYGSSGDAGSILSNFTSTPPSTPSAPSQFLTGMRLNIHVVTAPDLRVVTTYADRLSIEANLTVRGTAATPGILGHVAVTDGQLEFFGNTYTVNTGTVNFYSTTAIEPIVNFSLETLAQGVDVTLGVAGPINNLQLSYRSDPPLSFEQIVQLLATNTTPADPNVAANQPVAPQQSFTQMGESAVLGQAVANPLASRVQRVFGLSQFKIDPSVAGNNGQPSARVTLQQKIANNITFTYITDVTQTNSEIVRVQWDLTPKLSALGLRDYNGNVSIQMLYKFKRQ